MKTYTIRITNQAENHIKAIKHYVSNNLFAAEAADNLMQTMQEEIESLSSLPKRIKPIEEEPWHSLGIRKILVNNYYIYFWVDDANLKVHILAVIYARRNQIAQLELIDFNQ